MTTPTPQIPLIDTRGKTTTAEVFADIVETLNAVVTVVNSLIAIEEARRNPMIIVSGGGRMN